MRLNSTAVSIVFADDCSLKLNFKKIKGSILSNRTENDVDIPVITQYLSHSTFHVLSAVLSPPVKYFKSEISHDNKVLISLPQHFPLINSSDETTEETAFIYRLSGQLLIHLLPINLIFDSGLKSQMTLHGNVMMSSFVFPDNDHDSDPAV